MEDTLISFKTAQLAKKVGFDIETIHVYINKKLITNFVDLVHQSDPNNTIINLSQFKNNWNKKYVVFDKTGTEIFGPEVDNKQYFKAYSAPTQSLLQKWVREIHNINIGMTYFKYDDISNYWESRVHYYGLMEINNSYETALEEALYQALLLIKNKTK
jgi:hypothetical protein